MLNLIFCVDNSGLFGRNNGLPWNFKEDLKYFKDITTGNIDILNGVYNNQNLETQNSQNIIVMGYNTWISLKKKLPNRINVVISGRYSGICLSGSKQLNSTNSNSLEGLSKEPDYVFRTFEDFLYKCKKNNIFWNDPALPNKKIFIIGGKKLLSFVILKYYKYINNVFVTVVNHSFHQFLNDTVFKLSSFSCLELSKQTTNISYCNNYNDSKLYLLNFIHYKNLTYNSFETNNYINNQNYFSHNNYTLLNEHGEISHSGSNHTTITLENELLDIKLETYSLQTCKECGDTIEQVGEFVQLEEQDISKKKEFCNKCLYYKCKCIFC